MDTDSVVDELVRIYGDGGIVPTRQQWRVLMDNSYDGKIVIHQFMKFASKGNNDTGTPEPLLRYAEVSMRLVAELGGRDMEAYLNLSGLAIAMKTGIWSV
jgi:hypothetical protein